MKHSIAACTLILFFGIIFFSCEQNDNNPSDKNTDAQLVSSTGCKFLKDFNVVDTITENQSCIEFTYSNSTLYLTHVNAGFNCCPENITADFVFDGDTITIIENESAAACNCNCLFDLELQIGSLDLGTYTLIFDEPYAQQPGQEMEFIINLHDSVSGSYCVQRDFYPWTY